MIDNEQATKTGVSIEGSDMLYSDVKKLPVVMDFMGVFGINDEQFDSLFKMMSLKDLVVGRILCGQDTLTDEDGNKIPVEGHPQYFLKPPYYQTSMSQISFGWEIIPGEPIKLVAVKELHQEVQANKDFIDAFRKEALLTAGLDPDYVVPVIDVLSYDGKQRMVMELGGINLSHRMESSNPFELEEILGITRGIVESVNYLALVGVVHRDIKPSNSYLKDGRVRLGDFGIAVGVRNDTAERFFGSPEYNSPQLITKEINYDDPESVSRNDVYTIALIVYEMIAGVRYYPPREELEAEAKKFRGSRTEFVHILHDKMVQDYKPLIDRKLSINQYEKEVLERIDKVLKKALTFNPKNRQSSRDEFLKELTDAIITQSILEPVPVESQLSTTS